MHRHITLILLLILIVIPAVAQQKTRDKVKRKYRKAEVVEQNQPDVFLRGKIRDQDDNLLPGATVIVVGTKKGVNANEKGEYFLYGLPTGSTRIQVSFVGYKTKSVDFYLQTGNNYLNFTLDEDNVRLDAISVTPQKREQQILDVPLTMSVLDDDFLNKNNIRELDELTEFVPGVQVRMQGVDRPGIVIRGLASDEVSPAAQPRVSVYSNNVPVSRANGAAPELFDMQQVEVIKGPQGTLFGRGAQIGAIHYISKKPLGEFNGYLTAGMGDYHQREVQGAVNVPLIKNKLMVRAAGIYDYNEGYIKNTFGENLNGKNTLAGRFSVRFLPNFRNKIDLVVNMQKDNNPGLGFMSMNFPNTEGKTDPYFYTASLEQGNNLGIQRDIFDATLSMKHFFNENNFITSTSSYRELGGFSRWDGDGTASAAIDMSETSESWQFYQELRYNFSKKDNRLNGSYGASLWMEEASQNYWFSPNEQDLFHLFFNTGMLVDANGQPVSVSSLPEDPMLGPLSGMPLVNDHQEENLSSANNKALEGFVDFNYQLTRKWSVTAGARVIAEKFSLTNSALMSGGNPATLGMLTGNYPNLFFKPGDDREIHESSLATTYRAGLKYAFGPNANVFAGYSRGRRPKALQFNSAGEEQVLKAEIVDSYDLGIKTGIKNRIWLDLGLFYHEYTNFQTTAWIASADSGEFNYIVKDAGKASAYGAETNLKVALFKGLDVFGNYAYIHARFDSTGVDGLPQEYAGNMFRLTPEHSFAAGIHARSEITSGFVLFAVPSYSWKTMVFFEDANTPGIEQAAYGVLNIHAGIELPDQGLTLAIYAKNLLDEKYIVSAGNTGSLFGAPTQIPGSPKMIGAKLTWKFNVNEKPYYKRSRLNR